MWDCSSVAERRPYGKAATHILRTSREMCSIDWLTFLPVGTAQVQFLPSPLNSIWDSLGFLHMSSAEDVHKAMLSGYNFETLTRFLTFHLPDAPKNGKSLADMAYSVVDDAENRGYMGELVQKLRQDNPENPLIAGLRSKKGGSMSQEGDSDLKHEIFRLNTAVFGDNELGTTGMVAQLKQMNGKLVDIEGSILALTRTMPHNEHYRRISGSTKDVLMVMTVVSVIVAILFAGGVLGG